MNKKVSVVYNLDQKPFPSFELAAKMRDLLVTEAQCHYQVELIDEGDEKSGFVVTRNGESQTLSSASQDANIERKTLHEEKKAVLASFETRVYRPALRLYFLYIPLFILASLLVFFAVDLWFVFMTLIGLNGLPHWIDPDLLIKITQGIGVIWMFKLIFNVLVDYYGTALLVGQKGISFKRGILTRDVINVRFEEIRTIGLRQGILDRLLNIGILEFASSGTDDVDIRFINIANPAGVKREIEDIIDRHIRKD